jgi:hypothetical protein
MPRISMNAKPSWWFELPSVEHPRLLRAALAEADARGVTIGRISMGGGLRFLTDDELAELLEVAHSRAIDVYTFVSSRNSYEPLSDSAAGEQLIGEHAFRDAVEELARAAAVGVDGVLIADVGLLAAAGELRARGALGTLGLKTAAAISPRNAAAAALYDRLGATSINVTTASLGDLRAMRARLRPETSLDVYVEAPPDLGGGVRYRETPELIRDLCPLSLKIGIRNLGPMYPYGAHLEPAAEHSMREKVRRAQLVLQILARAERAAERPGASAGAEPAIITKGESVP